MIETSLLKQAEFHCNLGVAAMAAGEPDKAITAYRKSITIFDNPDTHLNLAIALLTIGDYAAGWQEFEHRWHSRRIDPRHALRSRPQWDGSPLDGRTLLIHVEQGAGDTIQASRYLPLLAAMRGQILLGCPAELTRILSFCGVQQLPLSAKLQAAAVDFQCPIMSLPLAFGTTLETIPPPCLTAPPDLTAEWAKRLKPGKRVGLCWAGNPGFAADKLRSLHLSQLAPLAAVKDITFYSLQVGYAAAQTASAPAGMNLVDLTPQITDFADTAALITSLNLVITTCTSVAHLAGSLGKPTWIMLPFVPDWRWMLDREDSPWYPSVRLFRQKTRGDWACVLERVAAELRSFT